MPTPNINKLKRDIEFTVPLDVNPNIKIASNSIEELKQQDNIIQPKKSVNYLDYSSAFPKNTYDYDKKSSDFIKRRELATKLSGLQGQALIDATKDMSDEDIMRTYYASTAFQDRAYRSLGYKTGDIIPENDLNVINKLIVKGIREGSAGKVERGYFGNGNSEHNTGISKIAIEDENNNDKFGSVVGHEMSHGIYTTNNGISPGNNKYYTQNSNYNRYGKSNSAINLLGQQGNDGSHDNSGIEEAADSSGLKVKLTRQGIYNMFNSAPMTNEQMIKARELNNKNRLIKKFNINTASKVIGDIASINHRSLENNGYFG